MREPYRTLFDGLEDHWLLGQYLWGDEPDWDGLYAEERILTLSSGERILFQIAWALYNGDREARIADLGALDARTRRRVLRALELTCEV